MLVLTRGEGESIAIGPDIVITVCRVRENRVRIGLTVPDDVRVLRSEIVGDQPIQPRIPPRKERAHVAKSDH